MFNLMLITNDADFADYAFNSGVQRIFVDLEVNGKYERQGHLDTLISKHNFSDVSVIRSKVDKCDLLVRLNPFYEGTEQEIDQALAAGADLLMLPMYKTAAEVQSFSEIVNGRAKVIPLLETSGAYHCINDVVRIKGVSEIYIGLNDLHRDLGLKFMFEPLSNGIVDNIVNVVKSANLAFGFGGLARIGEGTLPAELILGEHVRLGSSSVILSRTFHQRSESLADVKSKIDLAHEITKIKEKRIELLSRSDDQILEDNAAVKKIVEGIVEGMNV